MCTSHDALLLLSCSATDFPGSLLRQVMTITSSCSELLCPHLVCPAHVLLGEVAVEEVKHRGVQGAQAAVQEAADLALALLGVAKREHTLRTVSTEASAAVRLRSKGVQVWLGPSPGKVAAKAVVERQVKQGIKSPTMVPPSCWHGRAGLCSTPVAVARDGRSTAAAS